MQDKIKNIVIIIVFVGILILALIANVIKKDDDISLSERRKLASFPKITLNSVLSGKTSEELEKYVTDQFILRDTFKEIKNWFSINILKQQDNNKIFVSNGSIYKMEYPLNEKSLENSINKIENIYEKYLGKQMNVYYSIIPDKNYYLKDNHLKMDYSKIEEIMQSKLKNMSYIDIKDTLHVEDFYKTDLHWKQENIINTANKIKKSMNLEIKNSNYNEKEVGKFYGSYYGQTMEKVEPDTIKYLTNNIIDSCITYNYEKEEENRVYNLEKYNTLSDKYDIFLSGATPLIEIRNPNATNTNVIYNFLKS